MQQYEVTPSLAAARCRSVSGRWSDLCSCGLADKGAPQSQSHSPRLCDKVRTL